MRYRFLDTALGPMAIGWTDAGISRLLLPGDTPMEMRTRLETAGGVEDADGQPELAVRILAYAEGASDDFTDIALDLSAVPENNRRIYQHIRELGWVRPPPMARLPAGLAMWRCRAPSAQRWAPTRSR